MFCTFVTGMYFGFYEELCIVFGILLASPSNALAATLWVHFIIGSGILVISFGDLLWIFFFPPKQFG